MALVEAFQSAFPVLEEPTARLSLAALPDAPRDVPQAAPAPCARRRIDPMRNDGWTDIAYVLVDEPDLNARLSTILNEVCHVFHHHAGGTWQEHDKDRYATLLAKEIDLRPSLTRKLLALDDRVIQMVTYRAIELLKRTPSEP